MRAFVKVVEAGSFTRAADVLGTQKAHLSRVITQLERELGSRLLVRTTRALSPTETGREFFERAQAILAAIEDAERSVAETQDEPRGVLKLTCGVEFGLLAVSGWVRSYLTRYPAMRVEAEFTGRLVDLVHEGIDLAIRIGPLADSTLVARPLGQLDYGLFAAPGYLMQHRAPTRPAELKNHELIAFAHDSRVMQWMLSNGNQQDRIGVSARLKVNNSFAVRDAAEAGLGIAQLPLLIVADALRARRLVRVLPDWSAPPMPVHAVYASAKFLSPKVRTFVELAREAFRAG
ncbi:MAG TPA: LysR family transcriptional regulator [Usitatibacteraceae bacterium]|nr:LysR family transcriptional regulator [Usitatibacteraceae bacterium]